MRNIRKQEEAVLAAFKTMTLTDKEGKSQQVPALYADREKLEAFVTISTKADGVIETKNDPLKLPVIGICATAIGKNDIHYEGWIFTATRQDLNEILQQMYCLEVEDNMGNNDLSISRAEIGERVIGVVPVTVMAAKFAAALNM